MKNIDTRKNKYYLFDILLFLLVLMSELPRIYLFSNMEGFYTAINFIQIPVYFGLLFIITNKKYKIKQLILFTGLGAVLLVGYLKSGQAAYFRGLLLILAAKDVPFKRILHTCRMAVTSVFVLALGLWIIGLSDAGVLRRGFVAFGYVHPNIVAQVLMIIILLWITEKGESLKRKHYIVIECFAVLIYLLSGSKTATAVLTIAPVIMIVTKKLMSRNHYAKLPVFLIEISQLLVLGFTYVTAILLPQSSILKALDLFFTNRLFLNYYLLNKNGMKLFGQNVVLADHSGTVYNNIQDIWNVAITCDNSYLLSLLVMGLVPTAIFLFGYVILIKRAVRERNYVIISSALILAVYAFCESQMIELYNNFVYFYIMAAYGWFTSKKSEIGVYGHDT